MVDYGTLDKSYHLGRKTKKSLIYRLNRRTKEVIKSIDKYYSNIPGKIIDLGTADGFMLSTIKTEFPSSQCVGVEYSRGLVEVNKDSRTTIMQGDVNYLPIKECSFDIAIATAIIEHLPDPKKFLKETKRVLKNNGLIILTSPDPFWESIATIVGHLPDEQHCKVLTIKEISSLFNAVGYKILEGKKFMLSPVGMPFEIPTENIVRSVGLNCLFANQLVVGKKVDS